MDETHVAVGGAVGIMWIVREAFAIAAKYMKRNGRSMAPPAVGPTTTHIHEHIRQVETKVDAMAAQTRQLHDWHSKTDQDGVPVWYVRRSLEEAIERLATNIDQQTKVFTKLIYEIQGTVIAPKSRRSAGTSAAD